MKITKFDKKACTKINRILNRATDEDVVFMNITIRALIVFSVLPNEAEYLELSDYLTHEACRRGIEL